MAESYPEQLYDRIFVARQPIFTADMRIWGYELLFRHGEDFQIAGIADGDQATTQVIADGFNLAAQGLRSGSRALINFPRNMLVGQAPFVLPPEQCVVEILESVRPEPEVLKACHELKQRGYTLALDDYEGDACLGPLCALADIIKVDVLDKTPSQVRDIVAGLSGYKAVLLAEKVESPEVFRVCRNLGFTYFHGFFFDRPEIIPGRKLSTGQVAKVRLLSELGRAETDLNRLVDIIQTDLAISYRLLKYINSAFFRRVVEIKSLQRAAAMLGSRSLRQWLQVVLLSDLGSTDRAQELVHISVQRARFLQLLAANHPTPFDQDGMFLLGFLSLLDAILDQPMDLVLEEIPLHADIKSALVDPGSPHAAWVSLLDEIDRCNWPRLSRAAAQLKIPIALISRLSAEASIWTIGVMA